jgi:2-isopropylmalate synthase
VTQLDAPLSEADIIYDWNEVERKKRLIGHPFQFFDETLRDGIQSPSVRDPSIEDKLSILMLLESIGIDALDIGLPGAGQRAVDDCVRICEAIRDRKLRIRPAAAGRTHVKDIAAIVEVSQRVGMPIEVMAFIGSSPVRQYAESWDLPRMLQLSGEAVALAVKSGLSVTYVTEDTTRSRPEVLEALFDNAIEHGSNRLCVCDTVGHATPDGIRNLIGWTHDFLDRRGAKQVKVDWHGHNDRGLGVTNAIYALEYGADRVHGTMLGVGERVGNAALDQILVNLKLLGELEGRDLSRLIELCRLVSKACAVPIPYNYPLVGSDAFRTATGVHAAAIIKAEKKGHAFLADRIYSGVPAGLFGREQEIEVGHMSGESNVVYWLQKRKIDADPALVQAIFAAAKKTDHIFSEEEIRSIITAHRGTHT